MDTNAIISAIGAVISMLSAFFAFSQARRTARYNLFSSFDLASQISISNPDILMKVHNCEATDPVDAKAMAYLSIILDAFQHYHIGHYFKKRSLKRMEKEMKVKPTFLNNILACKYNQDLWLTIRRTYYAEFDNNFIKVIDNLIEFENLKKGKAGINS